MKLKELARDIVALGGLPFFILVLVRITILPDWIYFSKILIAGILFFAFYFFTKQNIHSGLAIIVLIFLSFYYKNSQFTIFALLAYALMIGSLIYIKESKKKIFLGIGIGMLSSLISLFLINYMY
ncbi:hypothetical protein KAS08_05110 [Candidatus Pacearchaeota archaeon]|nr:hypothetical protein [Candidatus Pacearchaeota archaeon]